MILTPNFRHYTHSKNPVVAAYFRLLRKRHLSSWPNLEKSCGFTHGELFQMASIEDWLDERNRLYVFTNPEPGVPRPWSVYLDFLHYGFDAVIAKVAQRISDQAGFSVLEAKRSASIDFMTGLQLKRLNRSARKEAARILKRQEGLPKLDRFYFYNPSSLFDVVKSDFMESKGAHTALVLEKATLDRPFFFDPYSYKEILCHSRNAYSLMDKMGFGKNGLGRSVAVNTLHEDLLDYSKSKKITVFLPKPGLVKSHYEVEDFIKMIAESGIFEDSGFEIQLKSHPRSDYSWIKKVLKRNGLGTVPWSTNDDSGSILESFAVVSGPSSICETAVLAGVPVVFAMPGRHASFVFDNLPHFSSPMLRYKDAYAKAYFPSQIQEGLLHFKEEANQKRQKRACRDFRAMEYF